jgi:hypothetical protein
MRVVGGRLERPMEMLGEYYVNAYVHPYIQISREQTRGSIKNVFRR